MLYNRESQSQSVYNDPECLILQTSEKEGQSFCQSQTNWLTILTTQKAGKVELVIKYKTVLLYENFTKSHK